MSNVTPQNNQPARGGALPVLAFICAFLVPIAGIILGRIALRLIYEGQISDSNRGLAIAAVTLGWIFTILLALLMLFFPWVFYFLFVFLISGGWH
jgi:hypothetical protein